MSPRGITPNSGLFIATNGLKVPRVRHVPRLCDVERAKGLLLDDLLGDFVFEDVSDKVAAVALTLLPFVRDLIRGPTPLHAITKPRPGIGGTLLAEVLCYPALGRDPVMQPIPDNDAEIQRRVTAALLSSPTVIVFDNLPRDKTLNSPYIASVVTSMTWGDRKIGTSEAVKLPVTNAWVATGNDICVSDEIAEEPSPSGLPTWVRTRLNEPGSSTRTSKLGSLKTAATSSGLPWQLSSPGSPRACPVATSLSASSKTGPPSCPGFLTPLDFPDSVQTGLSGGGEAFR